MSVDEAESIDLDYLEPAWNLDVDGIIRRGRRRRKGRRVAAVMVIAPVLVLSVLGLSHLGGSPQPLSGTTSVRQPPRQGAHTVPCDSPTRQITGYLNWPCPASTTSTYYAARFADMRQLYESHDALRHHKIGTSFHPRPAKNVNMRILAFGPLPFGAPGTTITVAELWQAHGTMAAQVYYSTFNSKNGDGGGEGGGGPQKAGDPDLLSAAITVSPECGTSRAPVTSPCKETVIVRAGATAVRLVRGPNQTDPPTQAHDGLATVDATGIDFLKHPNWRIQALDAQGQVLGSVSYAAAL